MKKQSALRTRPRKYSQVEQLSEIALLARAAKESLGPKLATKIDCDQAYEEAKKALEQVTDQEHMTKEHMRNAKTKVRHCACPYAVDSPPPHHMAPHRTATDEL